jgi:superoxide dismutase, Cu-Zn family
MLRTTALIIGVCLSSSAALAAGSKVEINAVTVEGVGNSIGTAMLSDSENGLTIKVDVSGVADGEHGFHVHEKGDCSPSEKDGKMAAANAAGPHFDPKATKSHKGPEGAGHEGDLPKLVAKDGKISESVTVKELKLADVAGRSLMIHEGGDNYTDQPENGGGKGRIACGVIPK